MSARKIRQILEREYRVEVDRGSLWWWEDAHRTLKLARECRARLRAEGETRDIRILRIELEVVE